MEELQKLTNIGFPIAMMTLVSYLKSMISVICMGRLGNLELAGGSLAIGFTNITGYSVLAGLAMGMEPLCSQSIGSQHFSIALLTLQRTVIILLLASIPIALLWINLSPLLLFLGQDPDITKIASLYCRFAVPDLIINCLRPLRIYLRNKAIIWPLMWCDLLAILLHIPISIFLTFTLDLRVQGLAISTVITNFNSLLFILIYLFFSTPPLYAPMHAGSVWSPAHVAISSSQVGAKWGTLLRLAIPSCLGVCLEWWWYEFMTILAGYIHNPRVTLATSAIVIQTTSLMYTLPSALSASASTRVGNELGAGRPEKARLATVVAVGLALVSSMLGLLGTTFGRERWGRLFTKDGEVLELVTAVLPIIGLCELANCPQTTSCGVLRGSARPGIGAGINFGSFYLVGAPVALLLGFVWKQGFMGLCYGLLAAQIACAVSILTVVYNTDWEKETMKATDLVGNSNSACAHTDKEAECDNIVSTY